MIKLTMLLCCCLPLRNLHLNSPYGYRVHPITHEYKMHSGIDLAASADTVYSITAGQAAAGYDDVLGRYIKITDGVLTCVYGHLSQILADRRYVPLGTPIAITGATGRVTGEHLHISICYRDHLIDPLKFLYQIMIKSHNYEH